MSTQSTPDTNDLEAAVEKLTESADGLILVRRMLGELEKRVESE